jgi:hypothetical protein
MPEHPRDNPQPPPNVDDEGDYELEPPDATIIAAEQRRGKDSIEASRAAIDIDQIYREADRDLGSELVEKWLKEYRFQFQVKHILIATALLAVALTLWKLEVLGKTLWILFMLGVASFYVYLQWQESKHQRAAQERRERMYARRRAMQARQQGQQVDDEELLEEPADTPGVAPADEIAKETSARLPLRFQFSLKQLLVTMTIAAVIFGAVHWLGGNHTATLLGFVAIVGLVVYAIGVNTPELIVLGWWLILVLYVLITMFSFIFGA